MKAYRQIVKADRLIRTRTLIEHMRTVGAPMTGEELLQEVIDSEITLFLHPPDCDFAEQISKEDAKRLVDVVPKELLSDDPQLAIRLDDVPRVFGFRLPEGMVIKRDPPAKRTKPEAPKSPKTSTDVKAEFGREHVSDKLSYLNQAARKFWEKACREDPTTHPNNATVSAWLVDKGLSPSLADAGASIIRPQWAHKGRRPEE